MDEDVKAQRATKRSYHSPRRVEQAAATRHADERHGIKAARKS